MAQQGLSETEGEPHMTTIALPVIVLVVGLLLIGLAAAAWGVDTRPGFADDPRR